jgi:hypothetical protein
VPAALVQRPIALEADVAKRRPMPGLPLTLIYDAPIECPAQEALRGAVENLVTGEQARPLSARVTISKVGDSYQASIASAGGSARVLSGSTCSEVLEGTSVVLALAVTPQRLATSEQRAQGIQVPQARQRNTPDVARETRWVLGASAKGDVGTLPHATLGFAGQIGLERSRWSAHAAGTYWLSARGTLPINPTLGGDFSWWTGAAAGCGAPMTGALRLDLCAGAELGVLSAVGVGSLSPRRNPSTFWGALTATVGARWAISGGFRLQGNFGVAIPLVGRRPFVLDNAPLHEPGEVAGRAEVGPEIVF